LANDILRQGNIVQTEKISYKGFQKMFGRSVQVRGPGMFIEILKRKAESAGGELIELNTWTLKMSQYDHIRQDYTKKKLSDRWHNLGVNADIQVHRDVYSAFLAYCVDTSIEENKHNPSILNKEWTSLEPVLKQMGLCKTKAASLSSVRDEACWKQHQSGSFAKENLSMDYNQDVVRSVNRKIHIDESLETCFVKKTSIESVLRTPCL
jgi:hypothetical protein